MTLTDTGPLIALLDADDTHHRRCVEAAERLDPGPMLTMWCCFTEAIYFLGEVGGFRYQSRLWELRTRVRLIIVDLTPDEVDRMVELMQAYADAPMDAADASLVAVAERRGFRKVFTLDSHFRFYRLADGCVLEVVPQF